MTEIVAAHLERAAKAEELLREYISDHTCITAEMINSLAAALAACAREEREKAYAAICQLCEAQIPLDANGRHTGSGHVGSHCYATLIRRALERAVGEKSRA